MPTHRTHRTALQGFTVIEMMITLVIAAVLMMVVVPGFTDMIAKNRMVSAVYSLRGTLMEARSEAMTERENVSVCASKDGKTCTGNWKDGYIAFFDPNADGKKVDGDGKRIVLSRTLDATMITISFSNTDNNYVLYNSRGNAQTVAENFNGTFIFCDKYGAEKAAGLIVSRVGNTTAAVDDGTDDDIVNYPNDDYTDGENVDCP